MKDEIIRIKKISKTKFKIVKDNTIRYAVLNTNDVIANYFLNFIMRYCSCEGLSFNEDNIDLRAFEDWMKEYIRITSEYASFLTSYGIDLNSQNLAEVGKGKYDSIIGPDAYEISFFSEKMKRPKLIFGDIKKGLLIYGNQNIFSLDDLNITRLITQNPISLDDIDDFSLFVNNLDKDITLGIYGNFSDKNVKRKLNMIKRLLENIDFATFEYDTLNDYYYAMVTTGKPKTKIR